MATDIDLKAQYLRFGGIEIGRDGRDSRHRGRGVGRGVGVSTDFEFLIGIGDRFAVAARLFGAIPGR